MYINNNKRKLDSRDLETVQDADYFTCVYYQPQGQKIRFDFREYKQAVQYARKVFYKKLPFTAHAYYTPADLFHKNENLLLDLIENKTINKNKFMFYAVKVHLKHLLED